MEQVIRVRVDSSSKPLEYLTDQPIKIKMQVIVETALGVELGIVSALGAEVKQELPKVIRQANKADINAYSQNKTKAKTFLQKTRELAKKHNLEMKPFDACLSLDEKKLLVFYLAENRVDFRELVKEMAFSFKKRIELRQVGPRDQVQKMCSVGICGKECCCGKFLTDFNHVSIKMAKVQGLSLMPNNITGACGKLLCCLEYENKDYLDVFKQMPQINSTVKTPDGKGVVVFNNLIKKLVQVKIDDEIKEYPIEIILKHNKGKTNA